LKDINITIDEYRKIIKDIVNLLDSALIEKKAVVHFGIWILQYYKNNTVKQASNLNVNVGLLLERIIKMKIEL